MKYLKPRQKQVLDLACEGLTINEMAQQLGLAHGTIKCHVAKLFRIFGVSNRVQLALSAIKTGNVKLDDALRKVTF